MERPVPSLGQVFAVLEELRAEDAVRDYALVGAVALLESPGFDRVRLSGILDRHGIRDLSDPAAH